MAETPNFSSTNLIPPQNIEVEEAILGGILLDPEAIGRVAEKLIPEAFYTPTHVDIYKAALALNALGKPTDLLTLTDWLNDQKQLERIGGQAKLIQLLERTVSAVNIDALAVLVMDKYIRRELIRAGTEVTQLGFATERPLEIVLDESEQQILNLTQSRPKQGLTPIKEIVTTTYQEIQDRHDQIIPPGLTSDFSDLDGMTGGFQRSDLIIIAGRPSMGKCLAYDSEIVLADGSINTIEQLYHQQQAEILTLNDNWKFSLTKPSAYIDDGIKPVFKVTTKLGRSIETTITHPYLTIQGWKQLTEIEVGTKIAIPRTLPIFGTQTLSQHRVKLLAYLIGDGCLTDGTPEFTNNNPSIEADFICSIGEFSPNLKVRAERSPTKATTFYVTRDRVACNELTAWLKELELWNKNAHQKTIPDLIFSLNQSQIALFLNRLFATDGWATVLTSGQSQIGYCSVSERLVQQVQHLLLRFGIIAAIKTKSVKYKDSRRAAWQLDITDARSLKTFIDEIGIFSKESAIAKIIAALSQKRYQTNRDLIPIEIWQQLADAKGHETWMGLAKRAGIQGCTNIHVGKRQPSRDRLFILATALENTSLQQLATSEIYWDEIVSIEYTGDKQVYDLTIPDTHNFVANDICVHNTAISLNVAYNMAKLHQLPVLVFSLEMSKDQLVQRLIASEAGVDSNRLRAGRISPNEWDSVYKAVDRISELPIFIDDNASMMVMEMRSQARKLQAEHGGQLGLIMIDYLQLMEGGGDNRVQEISKITRSLKGLARELQVPLIALSQLSRSVEARNNKRPMMSDLRESGCLAGDSLVTIADSGLEVPIRELVGKSGFSVWGINPETMKQEKAIATNAFCTGIKPVWEMTTSLGNKIEATANHKFYTLDGWKRLDELKVGDRIAMPRSIPCGNRSLPNDVKLGEMSDAEELLKLATSDIYWDKIKSIKYCGEEMVYDLTIDKIENFAVQGFYAHNSIEQDADLIIMLYRDAYYNPDTPDRDITELIITKHRNGPTGVVKLVFDPALTKFKNLARPMN
jgi:replicative DNA helicase